MLLRFYNTLTGRKEEFIPLEAGKVRIYTCGPTVYNFAHIGNFRTYVFQDLLRRWLIYRGYRVYQIMNLTDVDDKTIRDSQKEGVPLREFTDRYIRAFFEDIEKLNIQKVECYPRAAEHIQGMIKLIEGLMVNRLAYRGEDGSIYYRISEFKDYGKLSKINLSDLKAGARVKSDEYGKEQPRDFALWKAWDHDDGEVYWETSLGKGRPGWHIECSAMSMEYLGQTFDLHSGGVDLIFPHHENEIAQSEGATGKPFAKYWIHCEHLLVDNKKMSKSLGNFYTLRDLLSNNYNPKAIRYVLLSTHYRQQLNFTFESLKAAEQTLTRLNDFLYRLKEAQRTGRSNKVHEMIALTRKKFEDAMDDDLSINIALAALFDFVRDMNKLMDEVKISREDVHAVYQFLMRLDTVLGVMEEPAAESLPKEIEDLIKQREIARQNGDWATSDAIRNRLLQMGIILEDTKSGVKWKRKQ